MHQLRRRQIDVDVGSNGVARASERSTADQSVAVLVVVATLSMAAVAQGGFYADGRWLIGAGLALAVALGAKRSSSVAAFDLPALLGIAATALAGWALVRGAVVGEVTAGVVRAALLAAVAVVVAVCRRGSSYDRDTLESSVLAIGTGIAVTGWLGVAAHLRPWAVSGSSTWRAASTLTYPNAAAAVLVAVALLAIARRTTRPGSPAIAMVTMLCLTGAIATQSRAGLVGCVIGGAVLLVAMSPRLVADAAIAPLAGAAIAALALLPGLQFGDPARPAIAGLGLFTGASLVVADALLAERRRLVRSRLALASGAAAVAVVLVGIARGGLSLVGDRVRLGSADRQGTNWAALDVIGDHPIVGVGPGRLTVSWSTPSGVTGTRLVHNEYAQLIAELGIVGGVLFGLLLVSLTRTLRRAHAVSPSPRLAGAAAALVALAVHSAFDFLWHIPVVVLLGAVLFGLGSCTTDPVEISARPNTTNRRYPT